MTTPPPPPPAKGPATEAPKPPDENTVEVLQAEYVRLMHAMQTGVEYLRQYDDTQTDPKHMKVGVNSSLVSCGALVKLLMDKGLITEQEYWDTLVRATREEVHTYEAQLKEHIGSAVTLL